MKKLFETKTDEKHTITGNMLIEILGDYGIKAERKTIYDDIMYGLPGAERSFLHRQRVLQLLPFSGRS